MSAQEVGRVVGLWRYPVKSMAAEALDAGRGRLARVRGRPALGVRARRRPAERVPVDDDPRGRVDARARPAVRASRSGRTSRGWSCGRRRGRARRARSRAGGVAGRRRARDQAGPRRVRRDAAVADHDRRRSRSSRRSSGSRWTPSGSGRTCSIESSRARGRVGRARAAIGGMAMRVDQRDERCVIVNIDPATRRARPGRAPHARRASATSASASTARPCSPGRSRSATRSARVVHRNLRSFVATKGRARPRALHLAISQRLSWRRSAARGDTDVRSTASSSTRRPLGTGSRASSRATASC